LLDERANPNTRDKKNKTALYYAIDSERGENTNIISMLLEKNAELNYECSENASTPLLKAIEKNYVKTIRMLLQSKADVN
jgi:ankyrin repeat protein